MITMTGAEKDRVLAEAKAARDEARRKYHQAGEEFDRASEAYRELLVRLSRESGLT